MRSGYGSHFLVFAIPALTYGRITLAGLRLTVMVGLVAGLVTFPSIIKMFALLC